jgi:tetratricopeptide (TPR) repeat protein
LRAKEKYENAIGTDPEFASAHVQLALFWNNEMTFNNIGSQQVDIAPQEKLKKFKTHIRDALMYSTDEIGIDSLRAWEATVDLRFGEAHDLLVRYMAARPNDRDVSSQYVGVLMRTGRWHEALEHLGRAAELSADDPSDLNWLIATHVFAGDAGAAATLGRDVLRRYPDNATIQYQVHRALVWNGDYDEARDILPLIEASQLPSVNLLYTGLRQACADGDEASAREIMAELERGYDDDVLWIPYHVTGQLEKIEAVIRPIHDSGQLFALSEFLNYPYFDPSPYPQLMAILEREGIERPYPIEIPFACQL